MTINSTTRKTSNLAGNGNTHTYPFPFKVFADSEIVVKKLEVSTSIETTLTLGLNNDYIVTLNADQNGSPGGEITLKSGGNNYNLPSGFQIVITSAVQSLQGTDLTNQGGFYPEVINDALDKSAILHQQQQGELDRSIKFSLTNTIGSLEITENANTRKNKVLAFDNAGEFSVESEIGTYRGNWAASTAYAVRDIVKDTSTNNVFLCNTAHTSSGAQPLTTNTHSANWDLLVDAATATTQASTATAQATAAATSAAAALTSKNAAAASATAAATSETNANTHKNDAQTAKTAAETAKTAAETAKTAAEAALDSFDDRYLGVKNSNPTLDNDGNALLDGALYFNGSSNIMRVYDLGNTTWLDCNITGSNLTNVNNVAAALTNVNHVGGSITNVNTVATNINNVNTVAADIAKVVKVADDLNETVSEIETAALDLQETTSEIDTVANAITNVNNVGNDISNVNTVAGISSDVTTVAQNNTNVTAVGTAITNVNNVGNSITNVNTCATNLSGINSFAERYRTDDSGNNPSTSLNAGDLFYNQGSGKLLVYNGNTSAWEETQTVGNFFINTISSYSGTGGNSATFNDAAYKFTLSDAGAFAQQMLVSINGVVQKPNAGSNQPSEGFALDGANIVFSSPPPTGADYFIITIGASVSIGTPTNGTVTPASFANGTSSNNGKFLRANNGAAPSFETVNTDLVADTSPQLGGDLASNGNNINIADNDSIKIGTGNDLDIFHDGTDSKVDIDNGQLLIRNASNAQILAIQQDKDIFTDGHVHFADNVEARFGNSDLKIYHDGSHSYIKDVGTGHLYISASAKVQIDGHNDETMAAFHENGAAELYYDGNKKFNTRAAGVDITGDLRFDTSVTGGIVRLADNQKVFCGSGDDLQIYHDGTDSYLQNTTGALYISPKSGENGIQLVPDGTARLYYDNTARIETTSYGGYINGSFHISTTQASINGIKQVIYGGATVYQNSGTGTGGSQGFYIGNGTSATTSYVWNYENADIEIGTNGTARWKVLSGGALIPAANNTYDLGTSSSRVRNIYTNDLNLSNEGSSNDVDGTWGSYTIQEGAEDLFLVNKRNGKKYKFNLTEVS